MSAASDSGSTFSDDAPRVSVFRASLSQRELDCLLINALDPLDPPRLEALLELGANPNARIPKAGQTPLELALCGDSRDNPRRLDALNALLRFGADPNQRALPDGDAPIHRINYALICDEEAPEKLQALLDAGADPNARGRDGKTPLMTLCSAVFKGARGERQAGLLRQLVAAGADLDAVSPEGLSPFELASRSFPAQSPAVLRSLLLLGARAAESSLIACLRDASCPELSSLIQAILQRRELERCAAPAPPAPPGRSKPRRHSAPETRYML